MTEYISEIALKCNIAPSEPFPFVKPVSYTHLDVYKRQVRVSTVVKSAKM